MEYGSFLGLVHEVFVVKFADGEAHFELVECRRLRDVEGQMREPFALLFRGPAQPVLGQRMYRLEHAQAGVLELFLVPVGRDAQSVQYEAVFN